jgi:hypothetical protein
MSNTLQEVSARKTRTPELSHNERNQVNVIIDLLIPSDKDFPPPSSLHLIDTFLAHLLFNGENRVTHAVKMKQLRSVLHELNIAADGNFCNASNEKQRLLLRLFERRNPAYFQELWTLANHSYYMKMALR